jgi:AraC-like DNA-binding protein
MEGSPYAHIQTPIDFLRINITRRTLDDLSYDRGERRPGSLRQVINQEDPVLRGLALTLIACVDIYGTQDQLFTDHLGLMLHQHIIKTYGNVRNPTSWRGGLAPWQLRRACEMMIANMTSDMAISQLASACGLSTSYFANAFRHTTGMPPHRWLMNERVKRAKDLLRHETLSISDIALACGFVDQSHLTRVFARLEGQPPGRWRRVHCG